MVQLIFVSGITKNQRGEAKDCLCLSRIITLTKSQMINTTPQLNDPTIRDALILSLRRKSRNRNRLQEELRAHNGNLIVDVASISSNHIHAYEIKGETDKVRRLTKQATFYEACFLRNTLVTTTNHLAWSIKYLPEHWGLIAVEISKSNQVALRNIRPASPSQNYNPEMALLMLWRPELLAIAETIDGLIVKNRDSRRELAKKIGALLTPTKASNLITAAINSRFLAEKIKHVGDV